MDRWLDSLSEDWPSQPPSHHGSGSIWEDNGAPKSNDSQSSIPPRAASGVLSVNGKEPGKRLSVLGGRAANNACKEKTSSSLNISQKRQSNGPVRPQSPDSALKVKARNHSKASTPSMLDGTVAFKASPMKGNHETPEWKRRIVQGKIGPGDQTDMFGPMGLQSVFKPPTIALRSKAQQKEPALEMQGLAELEMSSSSPGYPMPRPDSEIRDQARSPNCREVGKENVEEEEHEANVVVLSEKLDEIAKGPWADSGSPRLSVIGQHSKTGSPATSTSKSVSNLFVNSHNSSSFDQSNSKHFTPLYVSKSNTIDGKVDYAAIDMGMRRLQSDIEKLQKSRRSSSCSRSEDNGSQAIDTETQSMSFHKCQINEITNQSLPEDLSVGTDAFAANGGFVSLNRGGYSNEGSFYKRPLSPSSSNPIDGPSGNCTQASSQALPLPRHSQRKLRKPSTPPRTPNKDDEERPRSSGSPLKLFDKYDTFTNNRLARHISRFEETQAQYGTLDGSLEAELLPSSPSPGPKVPRKWSRTNQAIIYKPSQEVSSFGSGELDKHDFNAIDQILVETTLSTCSWDDHAIQSLPGRKRCKNVTRGSRRPSRTDQHRLALTEDDQEVQSPGYEENAFRPDQSTEGVSYTIYGKRLPYSPEKDIARKRRRTLCSSEERERATLNGRPMQSNLFVKETPMAAASGRKRKDVCYDSERQAADPKTLAMRQILRPRNPTPNQSGSSNQQTLLAKSEPSHVTNTGYGRSSVGQKVDKDLKPKLDPPTQIVAGALATIALNTVQDMESGSRKVSVTTSDFFNEAQQIMALIRAEKRPRSSHNSTETSNMGQSIIQEEHSVADSTKDDLTRPPSREGGTPRRIPLPAQHDARIVSQLRRFEDRDELGLALPSSGKSIRINNREIPSLASPAKSLGEDQATGIESDPPNIRIREGKTDQQERTKSPSSRHQLDSKADIDTCKIESQGSSSSSTKKSLPTESSHGSANLKKIAPHSVAHLLSDQMADMFFDKERKVWVKRKMSPNSESLNVEAYATSQQTEEDLFGDIPDLSVDEMEELKRVKEVVSSVNTLSLRGSTTSKHDQAAQSAAQNDEPDVQEIKQDARPSTADGKVIPPADNSSAPSKYTNFAWSGPRPGTRTTSYGDDVWPDKTAQQPQTTLPVVQNRPLAPEVEHKISILQNREPYVSVRENRDYCQPRVVTVAFSSPLIQSPYQPDEGWKRDDESRLEESPSKQTSQLQKSARRPNSSGFSHGQRHASRRLSVGNSSLVARPMSRLDELDEMSLVRYSVQHPQTAMDLTISTPLPPARNLVGPPTTAHRSSIGFNLSPLADFTIHQIDRPLDSEEGAVVKQHRPQAFSNALSLTAQELVKHLTDMEPYEPYWDHLPAVDLKDHGLTSLHMLDEFCSRTQELDVARNCIRDLDGVPSTVRSLNIGNNCLSELTAWHTLLNLQYLNVSRNNLRSLKGFQGLLHLRALKADDNEIASLDGIEHLDGLLSLSLRGNRLSMADFDGFNL